MLSNQYPARKELILIVALLGLFGVALLGPHVAQPNTYHDFANQGVWLGVAHASDVLSNLPFGLAGLWGFSVLNQYVSRAGYLAGQDQIKNICLALFFCGLLATGVGSSWYHLQPDDTGLVVDRLTMAIAFAGLLGVAACERISPRSGLWVMALIMITGPLSLWYGSLTGNILPWAVVQFGGVTLLVGLSFVKPHACAMPLHWVVAIYATAKLFEQFDFQIYELTNHLVSGHTLKHLAASLVIFVVINALGRSSQSPQSRPGSGAESALT
jgi:hypothetical protein